MTRQSKRRAFLRTAVVATAVGVAGCSDDGSTGDGGDDGDADPAGTPTPTPEATTESGTDSMEGTDDGPTEPAEPADVENPKAAVDRWLSNAKNYDGSIDDKTRETDVTIGVGVDDGSGSNFAFGPPAIRVTEGTAVQWIWKDASSAHNVRERDGLFNSGRPVAASGKTFQVTLTEPGVYRYQCTNHGGALGMRGAIIVESQQTLSGYPEVDDWLSGYDEYSGRLSDETGRGSISVDVGARSPNGTNHSFDPVAILVDRGAKVVWEWSGRGGSHDVTWKDKTFAASDNVRDASYTYSVTFDEPGIYLYYCRGDRPYNGRGAVVVR